MDFPYFHGDVNSSIQKELWKYKNHKGAELFPSDITCYLGNEKSNKSITGPFKSKPFSDSMKISPLNSVPKTDTSPSGSGCLYKQPFIQGHINCQILYNLFYITNKLASIISSSKVLS
jgi:hypothetical protein